MGPEASEEEEEQRGKALSSRALGAGTGQGGGGEGSGPSVDKLRRSTVGPGEGAFQSPQDHVRPWHEPAQSPQVLRSGPWGKVRSDSQEVCRGCIDPALEGPVGTATV